ncbi:MAG: glycosyl transferase family 2 [Kiloniellales bacterium]|nr:glycosyl transferase family 2 [Kiloniellales bacterium]
MAVAKLDIVIPVLGAPPALAATLAALEERRAAGLVGEVVLVSGDGDPELRQRFGEAARVIAAAAGRGQQLAAGAQACDAPWLLFLHADTRLGAGWAAQAKAFVSGTPGGERAAAFRLAFDASHGAARFIAALANWRSRRLGLPYGDQGLLISRKLYEEVGGFRPLVLMEDVDLVRRIGRRRLIILEGRAVTSADRYRRDGWWLRPLRNLSVLTLYFLGVPPATLRRLYG